MPSPEVNANPRVLSVQRDRSTAASDDRRGGTAADIRDALLTPLHGVRLPKVGIAAVILVVSVATQILAYNLFRLLPNEEARRPQIEAAGKEYSDPTLAAATAQARYNRFTRQVSVELATFPPYGVLRTTVAWFLVGLALGAGWRSLAAVFAAVVLASLVDAFGLISRLCAAAFSSRFQGDFSFQWLFPQGHSLSAFGRLSVFSIWWSLVLAAALSSAWERKKSLVFPLVIGLALSKAAFPSFWHMIEHALLRVL